MALALKIIAWFVTCDASVISLIGYKISMLTNSLFFNKIRRHFLYMTGPINGSQRNAERRADEKTKFAIVSPFPKYAPSSSLLLSFFFIRKHFSTKAITTGNRDKSKFKGAIQLNVNQEKYLRKSAGKRD